MIICPGKPHANNDPELIPITMVLEHRLDALKVFLRVLRYLGQCSAFGENLIWEDSKKSPLYIAQMNDDKFGDVNYLPSMWLDIGGYGVGETHLYESAVSTTKGEGTTVMDNINPSISIVVRAVSDLQAYKLADSLVGYLRVLRRSILSSVKNLENIGPISVGRVTQSRDQSDNPHMYECIISFALDINQFYNSRHYAGPDFSPDPGVNIGLHLGTSKSQKRKSRMEGVPMFSMASFQITAGDENSEDNDFVVLEQNVVRDGLADASVKKGTATEMQLSASEFDFGDVDPLGPVKAHVLVLGAVQPGERMFKVDIPDHFAINIPGFSEAVGDDDITVIVRK